MSCENADEHADEHIIFQVLPMQILFDCLVHVAIHEETYYI